MLSLVPKNIFADRIHKPHLGTERIPEFLFEDFNIFKDRRRYQFQFF